MKKTIRILMVGACLLLGSAAPADAQAAEPSQCREGGPSNPPPTQQYPPRSECASPQANRSTAAPGEPIVITGECPVPGSRVNARLEPGGRSLADGTANREGNYRLQFPAPNVAPGEYRVVVTCTSVMGATFERSVPLTIVAAAAPARAGTLPRTGESPIPMALGGATLIGLGAMAVVASRRRRSPIT